ncbi:MAG: LuxR C-terminal-related transcriptional regulator [Anaerolineaceae bacterium]
MTRMLIFPGEGSCVVMDSPMPPEVLTYAVNNGEWTLPAPYGFLNPDRNGGAALQATCQNEIVVVTLTRPIVILPENAQAAIESLKMTTRQHQVLLALAEGLSTRQIALRLQIAERTVMYYTARLKEIFGSLTRIADSGAVGGESGLAGAVPPACPRPKEWKIILSTTEYTEYTEKTK